MPKYKIGDIVRVLPYEDIRKQFVYGNTLPCGCTFPSIMKQFCGQVYVIAASHAAVHNGTTRYYLNDCDGWSFTDEMLELDNPELRFAISFSDVMGIK